MIITRKTGLESCVRRFPVQSKD